MSEVQPERVITGVIGYPATHSRSPLIHNYWHRRYQIEGIYTPFEIGLENLQSFCATAPGFGVRGFNVTTPHKEAILAHLSATTPRADRIGAVNTVSFVEGVGWVGDSTDGWGFCQNLEETIGWRAEGQQVVLIGAGGAAAAIVDELLIRGASEVVICNRTAARAERIAAKASAVRVGAWPLTQEEVATASLLINGTSFGMLGSGDAEAAPWAGVEEAGHLVVSDLIYAPLNTPFLQDMRAKGAATVDGLGMLLHQARPGFEAWRGVSPEVTDELRALAETGRGYLP